MKLLYELQFLYGLPIRFHAISEGLYGHAGLYRTLVNALQLYKN